MVEWKLLFIEDSDVWDKVRGVYVPEVIASPSEKYGTVYVISVEFEHLDGTARLGEERWLKMGWVNMRRMDGIWRSWNGEGNIADLKIKASHVLGELEARGELDYYLKKINEQTP